METIENYTIYYKFNMKDKMLLLIIIMNIILLVLVYNLNYRCYYPVNY